MNVLQLERDIKELGYPNILVQHHGFLYNVKSNGHEVYDSHLVFKKNNVPFCKISTVEGFELHEKPNPANLLMDCEKCYCVYNPNDGSSPFYFYWPEEKEEMEPEELLDTPEFGDLDRLYED